jgi:uncharacterized protein (DUF58 family)
MLPRALTGLRQRLRARHGPMTASGPIGDVVLERRALYILPTREGFYYGAVLTVMLLAAVNYSNGLAYALTFMLGAIAMVATLHTHRNLSGLRLSAAAAEPVFAGGSAVFVVLLHNDRNFARHAVELSTGSLTRRVYVPPLGSAAVDVAVPAPRRGYLAAPPIKLRTRFPIGLWHAWSRTVVLAARCLVYPRPAAEQPLQPTPGSFSGRQSPHVADGDDFAGLRDYRHGDPMQRVAWKKAAAGHGWHTKQFTMSADYLTWLEWDALRGLDAEERLSSLCRSILTAEQLGLAYGLRLPGVTITPGQGPEHRARCLERLALFEVA